MDDVEAGSLDVGFYNYTAFNIGFVNNSRKKKNLETRKYRFDENLPRDMHIWYCNFSMK